MKSSKIVKDLIKKVMDQGKVYDTSILLMFVHNDEDLLELFHYNPKVFVANISDNINYVKNDIYKAEIIKESFDLTRFYHIKYATKKITDKSILFDMVRAIYDHYSEKYPKDSKMYSELMEFYENLIEEIDSDQIKVSVIENSPLSDYDKVRIACSIFNDDIKKDYYENRFKNNLELLASIGDLIYVEKEIKKYDLGYLNEYINNHYNTHIRKDVIKLLYKDDISVFQNHESNPNNNLNNINFKRIDPKITFGVELECCHDNARECFLEFKKLGRFNITCDGSVKPGIEIVSPILHFTKEEIGELKDICETLKKANFYTNETCGGHIHVGASYLSNVEEYKAFIYLYTNLESILYNISNREDSVIRPGTYKYARCVREQIAAYNNESSNIFKQKNKAKFCNNLKRITTDRYYGLNFKNLGDIKKNTIEFRMPNGEIEFNELIQNIKLFTLLIQRSKELAHLSPISSARYIALKLSEDIPQEEKLECLLEILFGNDENEKNIYRRRYIANRKLNEESPIEKNYKNINFKFK